MRAWQSLKKLRHLRLLAVCAMAFCAMDCAQCIVRDSVSPPPAGMEPPALAREFRGVWVATVGNIDWPSKPGLSAEQQQAEMQVIIDTAARLHLNAIVLQVRPACDAIYPGGQEPWTEYLTGAQGQPPEPSYDPLQAWIDAAHARGMELHAWFNPFRARASGARSPLDGASIARRRPELVRTYGEQLWLDPGLPAARQYSIDVIRDVVRRYDIDGVHIDDYFYPYPLKGADFPDEASWQAYRSAGGTLGRDDWRRQNINTFVHDLYSAIKVEKRWVKFGISPFGIYRPGQPSMARGFDAYASIYADSRLWLNQGWCDYLSPQLYWKVSAPQQPFDALLAWWLGESTQGRPIWPGLYTSRIADGKSNWSASEIVQQIDITRARCPMPGEVHFSARAFTQNRGGIDQALAGGPYAAPALVPGAPWLGGSRPPAPSVSVCEGSDGLTASWRPADEDPRFWCVYTLSRGHWQVTVVAGDRRELPLGRDVQMVAVSALGRTGIEGPRSAAGVRAQ